MTALSGNRLPGTYWNSRADAQRREQIVATGFLAIGPWALVDQDKLQLQMDIVDNQLDTLGRAILGVTVGCARCHDHKFDPLPQRDYYALAGIFRSHANVGRPHVGGLQRCPSRPPARDDDPGAA